MIDQKSIVNLVNVSQACWTIREMNVNRRAAEEEDQALIL